MKIKYLLMMGCLLLAACKTPKNVAYLQDSNDGDVVTLQVKELKLKPADKISIVVNTKSVELNNVLNLPMTSQIIGYTEQQSLAQSRGTSGYTIDSEGCIDYPLIGKIKVDGLSREQLAAHLKKTLEEKNVAKDAVVTVEYLNLGFSVLGEVNRPGFYAFENDQVSILQALGLAGDMNLYGRRDVVKVIRTENGQQKTFVLSMLDNKQLTSSPAYYLQQNDIVYVEPNDKTKRGATVMGSQAYTPYRGKKDILEQVAADLAAFSGAPVDPDSELILTPGTQGALFLAMGANVMPGDKVAIVEPDYFANRKMVEFFGGEMVPVQMYYKNAELADEVKRNAENDKRDFL